MRGLRGILEDAAQFSSQKGRVIDIDAVDGTAPIRYGVRWWATEPFDFTAFMGKNIVITRHVSLGAAALLAVAAVPGFAAPATGAAPTAQPAAAAQVQTRASLLKGLDSNFKAIDANGDGTLSSSELAAAEGKVQQRRLAAIRARVDGEFTKLDTNKDGQLSKAEFMAAAPSSAGAAPNGAKIVAQLDKNKDGKVNGDEYRAPALSRFDVIDSNHDGSLSATERQAASAKQ